MLVQLTNPRRAKVMHKAASKDNHKVILRRIHFVVHPRQERARCLVYVVIVVIKAHILGFLLPLAHCTGAFHLTEVGMLHCLIKAVQAVVPPEDVKLLLLNL